MIADKTMYVSGQLGLNPEVRSLFFQSVKNYLHFIMQSAVLIAEMGECAVRFSHRNKKKYVHKEMKIINKIINSQGLYGCHYIFNVRQYCHGDIM